MKCWIASLFFIVIALEVSGQQLYADSLLSQKIDSAFFSGSKYYWIQIHPNDQIDYLEFPGWSYIRAYSSEGTQETGTLLPIRQKSYPSYKNIIEANGDTLLLKLQGAHPLFNISENIINRYSSRDWRLEERQRLVAHGLFFGIVIVMALYNLMIFFAVKDQSYLWYVFSIVGFGLYMAFYYGFTLEYFWPSKPHWNAFFFALIIPLTNVCRILFAQNYLHTTEYVPKWNTFFRILLILYLIPLFMWLVSWLEISNLLIQTNYVIGFLGTTTMSAITLASFIVYLRGYKPALWFLVAFALFNIGGILFIFRELNYLSDNFLTRYVIQIGAVAQVVLFSLGLSNRLNRTRKMLATEKIEREKLAREREIEKKQLIEVQRNQLEQQVKERTQELEETLEQLKASESEMRELNLVKSKLFSIISHELKSPLTTVDSYLNLFINHYNKLSEKELSELSSKTRFSLQNLTLLMDNLLLWSSLQQDSLSFYPVEIDLRKLVDKSIKLFSLLIEQKNIKLKIDNQIDETILYADKDMIGFVVRNLIHNSIKFTPKNGLIHISARGHKRLAEIHIEDTGIGMTAEMIENILKRGVSLTREGTEKEKGSGIGLLMCKDFIEKNGGNLNIKTGRGTNVSFTVPIYTPN